MTEINASIEYAALQLAELLNARPAGLVTDIDGTISRIALTPDSATVEPEALAALELLSRQLNLVAAMSGRSARDASSMVGLANMVYVGNHGMERIQGGRFMVSTEAAKYQARVHEVLSLAAESIHMPGVIFEDKGVTASIHYRGTPEPQLAKPAILAALEPLASQAGLLLTEGRMVFELRPPVVINKGTAIRELVDAFALRAIVFLGDDVTDIDAMRAVLDLREHGHVAGATVGVIATESPQALIDHSDIKLGNVDDVSLLLARLANIMESVGAGQRADAPPA